MIGTSCADAAWTCRCDAGLNVSHYGLSACAQEVWFLTYLLMYGRLARESLGQWRHMRAESARMCRFSMVQLWVASGPAGCCLSHALFAARPLLQFFAGKLIRSGEVFTLLVGF